jgi:hypothetical protein
MPAEQKKKPLVHVLWINSGLSCDGDSVALTAAMQPSIEDIALGTLPGLPQVAFHWPLIEYSLGGEEFMEWRPCHLLFTRPGAARGKYRAVSDRYFYDPGFRLTEASWERLQIPVRTAFFFHNSTLGRCVAFYPGPAGATESLLALGAWNDLVEENPRLRNLDPDIEALLVYGGRESAGFRCFVVPINVCYELVGRVRQKWKGLSGGEEAWLSIGAFFTALERRCEAS